MLTVAMCTPHGGLVRPDYYRYVLEMQGAFPQHRYVFIEVDTMIVGKARNMIVEASLSQNIDVIWQIDDDVIIPRDSGIMIDQCMELGVVSALYYNRRMPYTPQAYSRATEKDFEGMYWSMIDLNPGQGLIRVDAVGAGCIACRADIFRSLVEPWQERCNKAADAIEDVVLSGYVRNLSPWFEFLERKGEDLYFSERLADMGIPIWLNSNVVCGHVGDAVIDQAQFNYIRDNGILQKVPVEGGPVLAPAAPTPAPSPDAVSFANVEGGVQ